MKRLRWISAACYRNLRTKESSVNEYFVLIDIRSSDPGDIDGNYQKERRSCTVIFDCFVAGCGVNFLPAWGAIRSRSGGDRLRRGEQLFELDRPGVWIGPSVMTLILGVELLFTFIRYSGPPLSVTQITPRQVGLALYGPYLLGVEMASMLLLAGLVGAYHLARQKTTSERVGGDE
jgi:hypothetical protein